MKALILIAGLMLGSNAFAANGDAGCGLGSLFLKDNTKLMQILASTFNGSFGSQTFGITSGTSNCSAQNFVKNDKQIQYFVEINQEDLSREMAQGHGDKLMTLAALHGCASDAAVAAFNAKAQASYEQILPDAKTNAVDMVKNMKAISMSNACQGS
jgi:hypothetical protein